MNLEEFPSFQKTPQSQKKENKWASLTLVVSALLLTSLVIVLSFRFLVGAKTLRIEILPKIMSASPSRQSSLLMEWMQNLDQSTQGKEWNPTEQEQRELLRFAASRVNELKQEGTSPALYALHIAGWGKGVSDSKDFLVLREASLSEESTLALSLYLLRQNDFSLESVTYVQALLNSTNEAIRKVGAAYFVQCVGAALESQAICKAQLRRFLSDPSDEVRWNLALGILRQRERANLFEAQEIEAAASEMGKLYVLIKNGDPTLLSRFSGVALESLARDVFALRYEMNPVEMKQELAEISRSHPDLRVRNVARSLESKFQEK